MSNHFINTVDISNFKCFESLRVEGLKSVNLIGGKNNIGKTAFMEALELHLSSKDTSGLTFNLAKMIKRRQESIRREGYFELDFIYANKPKMNIVIDSKKIEIEYFEDYIKKIDNRNKLVEYFIETQESDTFNEEDTFITHEPILKITFDKESRIIPIDKLINRTLIGREQENKLTTNFISSSTTEERQIAVYYGKLINLNKEEYLNDSLRSFDGNVIALKQIVTERNVVLKLLLADREIPVLLSSLGEGINRYIAILCAVWASQNSYLFIDEIENGIHYSNYPKLWHVIFAASKMANCQIFATTHSKECIEAFNSINEHDEGLYLELYRNKKRNIINIQGREHEQLSYSLTHGGEVRGE